MLPRRAAPGKAAKVAREIEKEKEAKEAAVRAEARAEVRAQRQAAAKAEADVAAVLRTQPPHKIGMQMEIRRAAQRKEGSTGWVTPAVLSLWALFGK